MITRTEHLMMLRPLKHRGDGILAQVVDLTTGERLPDTVVEYRLLVRQLEGCIGGVLLGRLAEMMPGEPLLRPHTEFDVRLAEKWLAECR